MRIAREVALYNQGSIENGIDDASKVATSFITFVSSSEGIKVHNADDLSDYIQVNSNAISMYRGNVGKMELTDSSLRLGDTSNNAYIDTDGMEVKKGGTSVAKFGTTARVGAESSGHTTIQPSGMTIYGGNGTVELANLGYGEGTGESGRANAPYYTLGERILSASHPAGNYSMAEGLNNTAEGYVSHAEGYSNQATNSFTHVEGYQTVASGRSAHAEGMRNTASGDYSHAEGHNTEASGENSHASGWYTIASGDDQTVVGRCNYEDQSALFIVGNGIANPKTGEITRSNALTVEASGDVHIQGDLYTNSGTIMPVLKVSKSSVSSLSTTIVNANITANMECIHSVLSNPSAQTGDWTVTTSAGSAVISGSISGTTDITLYLAAPRT